ncbi:hypothetical protein EJB05_24154, partial [Eragrostis curvula]
MSSPAVAILGDLTQPGLHFAPVDDEIVQLYLLPRVRGHPDLFPGLIIDDDTAANTQPWVLFQRHGLPEEDGAQAFFFVHGGARPDRRCQDGGTWKSQKRLSEDEMGVDGEKIKWSRHNLNFHMDTESGSKGWVMHEYTVAGSSSLMLCSISFSGYGQKRKRVPDGYDGEPATRRPRVAAEESGSDTSGSGTKTAFDQAGFSTAYASQDQEQPMQDYSFQAEQVQQTMNASPPDQEPTAFNQQEPGLPQDAAEPWPLMSQDDMAEVFDIMSQAPDEQVPLVDQTSCDAPNFGDTDAVHWEGIDFTFSYDEDNSMC